MNPACDVEQAEVLSLQKRRFEVNNMALRNK